MKITTRRVLLVFALSLASLVALFLYQNFGPNPPIVVSTKTTWLTAPLKADGTPDYLRWYLDQQRSGVTPQNNAAVPFLEALWPGGIPAKHRQAICDEIGLPMPTRPGLHDPSYDTRLADSVHRKIVLLLLERHGIALAGPIDSKQEFEAAQSAWNEQDSATDEADSELGDSGSFEDFDETTFAAKSPEEQRLENWQSDPFAQADEDAAELIYNCQIHAWTADQMPALADWVERNQRNFDLLHEATRRPEYYLPSPEIFDDPAETIASVLFLHDMQLMRSAIQIMAIRANYWRGQGDYAAAWRDLVAAYKLADHIPGDSFVGQLVLIACHGVTHDSAFELLMDDNCPEPVVAEALAFYQSRPQRRGAWQPIDQTERTIAMDLAVTYATHASDIVADDEYGLDILKLTFSGGSGAEFDVSRFSIDWNVAMERCNDWYDKWVNAFKQPTYLQMKTAVDKVDNDLNNIFQTSPNYFSLATNRAYRSQFVGDRLAATTGSSYGMLPDVEGRYNAELQLMQVALALRLHKSRQGSYPDKLDALVPTILSKPPVDNLTGKPLVYQKIKDGYLLFNVGLNGIDEGGSHQGYSVLQGLDLDDEKFARDQLGLPEPDDDSEGLESLIPSDADDLSLRVPASPVDWSLLVPPKRKPVGGTEQP
jgi:hypothetical protein